MTKSVKELIYDYLNNGKEATVARKMHYFDQLMRNKNGPAGIGVTIEHNPLRALIPKALCRGGRADRTMYLQNSGLELLSNKPTVNLPRVVMSPSAIQRRFDDEKLMAVRGAVYGMLRQEVRQVLNDTGYTRAVETAEGGAEVWASNMTMMRMHSMHDYPSSLASEFDGDTLTEAMFLNQKSKEKTMYYTINPLTTELFHSEICVLNNLNGNFNGSLLSILGHGLNDIFEKLLKSMAELGTPSIRLDHTHRFTELLVDGIFPYDKPELLITAPTEDNPNVVITIVVDERRTDVTAPCFAVEIGMHDGERPVNLNGDLEQLLKQYCLFSKTIVTNIFYGNIPVRNAFCGPYIERIEPGNGRPTRKCIDLDIGDLYATAGHHAETLLGNNVVRQEYIQSLENAGVRLADHIEHDATAFWDEVQGGWVIQPVLPDNLDRRFTVFVTEDELVHSHFPTTYRHAARAENRKKASSVAKSFFSGRLPAKAE